MTMTGKWATLMLAALAACLATASCRPSMQTGSGWAAPQQTGEQAPATRAAQAGRSAWPSATRTAGASLLRMDATPARARPGASTGSPVAAKPTVGTCAMSGGKGSWIHGGHGR